MFDKLTLVSFDLCPYVQRVAIVLGEKGVPFTRVDIDLSDKPEWFKSISPFGKVPLLQVGGQVLFESSVIVEYLEETQPGPLHPTDPLEKARHRSWMEFGSSILADIWVIETTRDSELFSAKRALLREKFHRLEGELGSGPFFAGPDFCVVDAVFAPVFRYFDVFDEIVDLEVFKGLDKLAAWRKALAARPSVIGAVVADYPARLHKFLKKHDGHLLRIAALGEPIRWTRALNADGFSAQYQPKTTNKGDTAVFTSISTVPMVPF
ncbi:MAG: Glutathione S-transferase [Cypionkella sp.]|uniref:glutathione S-transferase family protein n=1 Tax=Cypionkella sp. TaxID=2811411 RepID=UPI00261EDF94|nr:glutathione S-transferase family protein [Cypionkella sp.]MDB5659756.1 Glutathione S-transferase [Cypionkella sp.]